MDGTISTLRHDSSVPSVSPIDRGTTSLVTGCMFSGKTTALIKSLGQRPADTVVVVKHVIDTRYRADAVVSHGGKAIAARAIAAAGELPLLIESGIQLAAVDEAHFFDESLVAVIDALSRRGVDVMLTSLDLDSWGRPFPLIERIARLADEHRTLTASCASCGAVANHTQRLTPIVNGNMVGGPESYEPRCANCWRPPPEPPPA